MRACTRLGSVIVAVGDGSSDGPRSDKCTYRAIGVVAGDNQISTLKGPRILSAVKGSGAARYHVGGVALCVAGIFVSETIYCKRRHAVEGTRARLACVDRARARAECTAVAATASEWIIMLRNMGRKS